MKKTTAALLLSISYSAPSSTDIKPNSDNEFFLVCLKCNYSQSKIKFAKTLREAITGGFRAPSAHGYVYTDNSGQLGYAFEAYIYRDMFDIYNVKFSGTALEHLKKHLQVNIE